MRNGALRQLLYQRKAKFHWTHSIYGTSEAKQSNLIKQSSYFFLFFLCLNWRNWFRDNLPKYIFEKSVQNISAAHARDVCCADTFLYFDMSYTLYSQKIIRDDIEKHKNKQ